MVMSDARFDGPQAAFGQVHQLRPRFGVLHLDDVDVGRLQIRPGERGAGLTDLLNDHGAMIMAIEVGGQPPAAVAVQQRVQANVNLPPEMGFEYLRGQR